MKLQGLTESMKGGLAEQSTLRSELAKKEKLVEELRSELAKKEKLVEELKKEIEVNICNYCICVLTCLHSVETCNPSLLICRK